MTIPILSIYSIFLKRLDILEKIDIELKDKIICKRFVHEK